MRFVDRDAGRHRPAPSTGTSAAGNDSDHRGAARLPAVPFRLPRRQAQARRRSPGWRRPSTASGATSPSCASSTSASPAQGSIDGPPVDPARTFNINEKSYAAYGQLNYEFELGGEVTDRRRARPARRQDQRGHQRHPRSRPPVRQPIDFQNRIYGLAAQREHADPLHARVAAAPGGDEDADPADFRAAQSGLALDTPGPPGCDPAAQQPDCVRTGRRRQSRS